MGSTLIAVTESITYNDINVSKFENIFNDLLINGYIIAKSLMMMNGLFHVTSKIHLLSCHFINYFHIKIMHHY